jgi:hypothetical protein
VQSQEILIHFASSESAKTVPFYAVSTRNEKHTLGELVQSQQILIHFASSESAKTVPFYAVSTRNEKHFFEIFLEPSLGSQVDH